MLSRIAASRSEADSSKIVGIVASQVGCTFFGTRVRNTCSASDKVYQCLRFPIPAGASSCLRTDSKGAVSTEAPATRAALFAAANQGDGRLAQSPLLNRRRARSTSTICWRSRFSSRISGSATPP